MTDTTDTTGTEGGELRRLLRGIEVFAGELPSFDPLDTPGTPVELFTQWLRGALRAGVREPHAMTLATADGAGDPAARVLILKDVDEQGWQFASDGGGPKGRQLAARPFAALTFYWAPLARQVRVRGPVVRAAEQVRAADFLARGAGARAESLLGRQSRPLADLAERDAAVAASLARLAEQPELVSPDWTVYAVQPETVEFWQGDRQRRHTRLVYRATGDGWAKQLLWP
ncbi:pyridoxine/pyridoxamine 5'-phosphate oxidase [Kitasatospora sp. LaBMicrA B282]|uniref:pyridoxine/pyridoxamine 5'-phosphate oxidase n=1 Tax=Kitasatospora sp. LaBMicrA B282 TaxID=3420949 RepID=UPI003D1484EE